MNRRVLVPLVALAYLLGQILGRRVDLGRPPPDPLAGIRIKENLHVRLWKYHRADVTALHYHAGAPGDFPLLLH